jgi:hypothetical protein
MADEPPGQARWRLGEGMVERGSCDVERIPVGYLARLLSLDEIQP